MSRFMLHLLLVDIDELSDAALEAIVFLPQLQVNGMEIEERLGQEPLLRPQSGGDANVTILPSSAYQRIAQVIETS
jgi:hypothetical protein